MPIARTVWGLIYYDEFDGPDMNGWTEYNPAQNDFSFYSADKHSGSACAQYSIPTTGWSNHLYKTIPLGPVGSRIHIWHNVGSDTNITTNAALRNADYTLWLGYHNEYGPWSEAWTMHSGTTPSPGGNTDVICNDVERGAGSGTCWGRVDKLVVFASLNIIMTGLTPGQKVELYRASDNTLLGNGTCAGGQSSVTITINDSEDVPEQMYFKVYATDGSTLIETTASYDVCGGDTWDWTPAAGTLTITVDADIIYRSAAAGTPKTCNVTANLKTPAGANYPGATVYFSTTLGAVSPSSDVTDASGNAETALTSSSYGIAVVKAWFLGDATVPACSAYCTVHVFYEAEAPDSSKDFQFYVEGIEYAYVTGRYTQSEVGEVNDFEVEIPEWLSTITSDGFVNIYRLGVKEFHGLLKGIKRSLASDRIVLRGPDVSRLLGDRVVDTKIYAAKTAQYMINDLLSAFPCGIYAGSLGSCPDTLTITIETESLLKAIPRICDLVGWRYRVKLDRTLDFAESFTGGTSSASFTEGDLLIDADRDINYLTIANKIRMKGDGIYSTKQDGTKIQEQGLHEAPAFNKSITDQATLDAACQALVDMKKIEEETIPVKAWDEYDPGTFGPEDYVTITAPSLDLSGLYQIRKITRSTLDAQYVELELSNRTKAYWELDEEYRRMTKDANV
jgi:hypothetical protein